MIRLRQFGFAIFAVVLLLTTIASVVASDLGKSVSDQVDVDSYRHYLDDMLYTHTGQSRSRLSPQHDLARDNIANLFESFGLDVELEPFSAYGTTWYNVVATQTGVDDPEVQYIVGAHFDSVSCPGADDNASGTAAVLEIARVVSQYDVPYTIKYIAFDLEEVGLLGSHAYVAAHGHDNIRAMINFDMISWRGFNQWIDVAGPWEAEELKQTLHDAVLEYGRGLRPYLNYGSGGSDHASFIAAGIHAVMMSEKTLHSNPCYHSDCDTVDNVGYIDYVYASNMTRVVAGFLADPNGVHWECLGDLDGSLQVNIADLAILLSHYGMTSGATMEDGDLDYDGDVDLRDLAALLARYGVNCLPS